MRDNYRQCSASIDREVAHPIRSTNTVESDLCVEVGTISRVRIRNTWRKITSRSVEYERTRN